MAIIKVHIVTMSFQAHARMTYCYTYIHTSDCNSDFLTQEITVGLTSQILSLETGTLETFTWYKNKERKIFHQK